MTMPKMIAFLLVACASLQLAVTYQIAPVNHPFGPRIRRACAGARSCEDCFSPYVECHWSVERQTCLEGHRDRNGNLTVRGPAFCPALAPSHDGRAVRLSVANDVAGLLGHMARAGVNCSRGGTTGAGPGLRARVIDEGDGRGHVLCPGYQDADAASVYFTVGPERVMLRTDDRTVYYNSAMYDRECGTAERDEYCVVCLRTGPQEKRFYTQWCPRGNGSCVDWSVNTTERAVPVELGDEEQARCNESAEVLSFSPTWSLWHADDTPVTVRLRGHDKLSAGVTMRVTVAGQPCLRPRAVGADTFECWVIGPMRQYGVSGPVRVVYGPTRGRLQLADGRAAPARRRDAVVSAAEFRFVGKDDPDACVPRVVGSQTFDGVASGGTSMVAFFTGAHCVDPAAAGVALYGPYRGEAKLHAGECTFPVVNTMVCRSPATIGPRAGDADANMTLASARVAHDAAAGRGRVKPIGEFRCGFLMYDQKTRTPLNVPCGHEVAYWVYADPAFTRFNVTDGGAKVVIGGYNFGNGFGSDDVAVRFASGEPGLCDNVGLTSPVTMDCRVPEELRAHAREGLNLVWVAVGSAPPVVVQRHGYDQ